MTQPFRWGILGPGSIARSFAKSITAIDDAVITAVASRAADRAEAFAREFDVPRAHTGYDALASDPEVDAIYVATPHPFHDGPSVLCLSAGKPVLCEKPLAANSVQARRITTAARDANTFMMEAMWTRFLPAVVQVRQWLNDGRIGEVLRLEADFSFRAGWNPDSRLLNPALAGGSLLDVGIYVLSMAFMVFGEAPEAVSSQAHIGTTGVDEQAGMVFRYRDGALAILSCGVRVPGANAVRIIGTEGTIEIPGPFFKTETARLIVGDETETVNHPHEANGYEYEAREVARCVREGLIESPVMPHAESLAMADVMDRLRADWGVRYPFE